MSKRPAKPSLPTKARRQFLSLTHWRVLIVASLLSGGIVTPGLVAWANGPTPGTVIENQATGSFVDPSDSSTTLIESNVVQVTVAEVAGITVTSNGFDEPTDSTVNEGDTVYFDFVITNVGNDPTQFVIPGTASVTNGTQNGDIQIIEYDADGTGAGAAEDLSGSSITIPSAGDTSGNLLNGVANTNDGVVPAGGSITVRVPITAGTAGNDLTVTLGDGAVDDGQNEAYVAGTNDVYTQDNADVDEASNGAPINGEREAEANASVTIQAATASNNISGTVFEDFTGGTTGDNIPNGTENTLGDITLTLYQDDGDGIFDSAVDTQITTSSSDSGDGTYSLGAPSDGKYFVVLDHLDSDAPNGSISLPDRTIREVDVAGVDVTDEDFPYDTLPPNLGSCPVDGIISKNDPSDIFGVNLVTGGAQLLEEDLNTLDGSTTYLNGIGFSVVDDYVYGVNPRLSNISVVRLDGNYQATILGPIPGLSNTVNFNTGDVSRDGKLYLTTNGRSAFSIVDVNPTSPTYLQYLGDITFQNRPSSFSPDWAFHPADGQLYIIDADGSRDLNRVDPATGVVTNLGPTGLPVGGFGAVFFDAAGYFYIADNNANISDGQPDPAPIYRIDVTDPNNPNSTAVLMGRGPTSGQNDGARCMDAPLPVDFGDAPDTGSGNGTGNYETLLSNNGPRHFIDGSTYLGSGVSSDTDGFVEGTDSNGDATDDAQDDGIQLNSASLQGQTLAAGDTITLDITTAGTGVLNAWIDWNGDGTFDVSEQIATNADVSGGTLSVTVPASATLGTTYTRFRYSSDTGLSSTGSASDGEVEDYSVAIATPIPTSLDYGDAPDSYSTDATDNNGEGIGARHGIVSDLYLGLPPDAETDAVPPLDGNGDGIDEDGVTVRAMTADAASFLVSRDEISVTNDTGSDATLHGWIDFNKDGTFSAAEHTSLVIPTGSIGVNPSTDLIWNGLTVGSAGETYARFRLTTDSTITNSTPGGTASDGEVEDYLAEIVPAPPTQSGGACSIPYSMVYSGHFPNRIDAIHVDSGAFVALTTSTIASNTNSLASDHINNLVYYAENNSLYAWSPITDTHTTISSNFGGFIGGAIDLGSGGAAFYNGSLYLGTDVDGVNPSEVYRVDFVPSSAGLTIQSVTSLNLAGIMPTTDWGDLTIDENGLLLASGGGGVFWTYDLFNSTFTTLSSTVPGDQHQFAKDGMGRLWAIVYTPTMFVVQVEVTGSTIQPVGSTISVAPHDTNDGAECVIGESSIGDRIWADTDGDGVQDPGENGIGNVTVDLYWDIDGDGQIDPGDDPVLATQTTGSSGSYDFFDLIFGDYIVQVTDTNNVLTDYTLTTSSDEDAVTLPVGVVDFNDADFGYQPPTTATDPNMLLVKRITAINRGQANELLFDNTYVDGDTPSDADNETNWPGPTAAATNGGTVESYIPGIINGDDSGVTIRPGDKIEYTIPFLSNGDVAAQNVLICDRIPANTTFIPDAFNSSPPAGPGFGNHGILVEVNGSQVALTNANDGDEIPDTGSDNGVGGYYFPPGIEPSTVFPGISCNGTNNNGAVVVDLSDVPNATSEGTPTNAYGFIRFRANVN